MSETFQDLIKSDRARLNGERKALVAQQREIEKKLAEIDRELAAIAGYETIRSGKAASVAAEVVPAAPRKPRTTRKIAPTRGRRDSKREPILKLLADNPDGLTRGELLEKLGVKGDKSGEMSVSNALTGLTKSNQIRREDGKYLTG